MDLEQIFQNVVGGHGLWQIRMSFLLFPQHLAVSMPLLLHLFTAYTPRHRCKIANCDAQNLAKQHEGFGQEQFLDFALPQKDSAASFVGAGDIFDSCHHFKYIQNKNDSTCRPSNFDEIAISHCESGFVYDTSLFKDTLTIELDLVCDNVNKRHFMGSVMMMGLTLGSILGGRLSDRLGRKRLIVIALSLLFPSMLLGGMVSDYATYMLLRLVSCTLIVFCWISGHNYQLEFFNKEARRVAYLLYCSFALFSGFALPLVAYLNREWRQMHLWSAISVLFAIPITQFGLPESAAWLACNGRWNEAEHVLRNVARVNGRVLGSAEQVQIREALQKLSKEALEVHETDMGIMDLFRRGFRKRTSLLMCCWITFIVTSYALILNVQSLSGDIFVNFCLTTIMELPANLIIFFLVDRIGRRSLLSLSFCLLSLIFTMMAMAPRTTTQSSLTVTLFLMAKLAVNIAGSVIWLYTSELYPTNLRSTAVGTCSMVSRIFGMSSSFFSELTLVWAPLPMVIVAVPSFLLSVLVRRVFPETMGRAMPETIEEAIMLDNNIKIKDLGLFNDTKGFTLLPLDDQSDDEDPELT